MRNSTPPGVVHHTVRQGDPYMRMNRDVRLRNNNQRHTELLRHRIEELDQQLAILNSERGRFEKLLDGVRE